MDFVVNNALTLTQRLTVLYIALEAVHVQHRGKRPACLPGLTVYPVQSRIFGTFYYRRSQKQWLRSLKDKFRLKTW